MSDIERWSSTASSNNAAPPDGFPENMARSDVNNSARELMAATRRMWDDPDWKNPVYGYSVAQGSSTSVVIQGVDASGLFNENQKVRVRCASSASAYAFVASVSYSSPDTTVTLDGFDTLGTPSPSTTVPLDANGIDVYFLGGGVNNNHGIGRGAFEDGDSAFEIPTDSTATAINAAIVASQTSGKAVLLPAGTITLDDEILIPASSSDLKIIGAAGIGTLLSLDNSVNKSVIRVANSTTNIVIENLEINGNRTNQSSSSSTLHRFNGIKVEYAASNLTIRDCIIRDCQNNGISLDDTTSSGSYTGIKIENVKILRTANNSIFVGNDDGNTRDVFMRNIEVVDPGEPVGFGFSRTAEEVSALHLSGQCSVSGFSGRFSADDLRQWDGSFVWLDDNSTPSKAAHDCVIDNFVIDHGQQSNGGPAIFSGGWNNRVSNGSVTIRSSTNTLLPSFFKIGNSAFATGEDRSGNSIANCNFNGKSATCNLLKTENTSISDCTFKATHPTATNAQLISMNQDVRPRVVNCSFEGNYYFVNQANNVSDYLISGCNIISSANGSNVAAMVVSGLGPGTVTGCHIQNTNSGLAIRIAGYSNSSVNPVFITGNTMIVGDVASATNPNCITVGSSSTYTDVRISGNHFHNFKNEVSTFPGNYAPYVNDLVNNYTTPKLGSRIYPDNHPTWNHTFYSENINQVLPNGSYVQLGSDFYNLHALTASTYGTMRAKVRIMFEGASGAGCTFQLRNTSVTFYTSPTFTVANGGSEFLDYEFEFDVVSALYWRGIATLSLWASGGSTTSTVRFVALDYCCRKQDFGYFHTSTEV